MFKKPQPEAYIKRIIKRIVDASTQVPADTAVLLIYNMTAVKVFAPGLTSLAKMKTNQPVLFMYQPESQPSDDHPQSKLGDKLRLEKFERRRPRPIRRQPRELQPRAERLPANQRVVAF